MNKGISDDYYMWKDRYGRSGEEWIFKIFKKK